MALLLSTLAPLIPVDLNDSAPWFVFEILFLLVVRTSVRSEVWDFQDTKVMVPAALQICVVDSTAPVAFTYT